MRVRHRVPSIFSLSMVDVLCCALGCVILLWLLNAKQQDDDAQEQARATASLLEEAKSERERSGSLVTSLEADNKEKESLLAAARADRDGAKALLADVQSELAKMQAARLALEKRLAEQEKEAGALADKVKSSAARVASLERDLQSSTDRLTKEKLSAGGLTRRLAELEGAVKGLRADLDRERAGYAAERDRSHRLEAEIAAQKREMSALGRTVKELLAAKRALERGLEAQEKALALATPYRDRWAAAEDRVKALEKEVRAGQSGAADLNRAVLTLQKDRKDLQERLARARAAGESRFAGIQLTGRRVIFLVDISGSMEMLDEDTPAPSKWLGVRQTVAQIMRSLPDLEKFQVIAFSSKASFPLGGEGAWLDHDPKASPEKVLGALAAIKPRGGTNMYDALKEAFRYRARGLDTIYLLSDGLPNLGEGLPASGAKDLREVERGVLLGRHVRKTLRSDWNAPGGKGARVKINTVGFFYESPDLGAFLWALARENDGSFVGMSKP